jgi:hypothetical protein
MRSAGEAFVRKFPELAKAIASPSPQRVAEIQAKGHQLQRQAQAAIGACKNLLWGPVGVGHGLPEPRRPRIHSN